MLDHILNLTPINCESEGKAPRRFLLIRDGDVGWAGREGFTLDAEAAERIIQAFQTHGADIPIDYHHATEKTGDGKINKAPACGWIKNLEYVKGEGLFAVDVEWTAEGKDDVESLRYRYCSPSVYFDKDDKSLQIVSSVALTNKPRTIDATELMAIAAELTAIGKEATDMAKETEQGKVIAELETRYKALCEGLRIDAQEMPNGEPAITDDMKAVADLMVALQAAGVQVGTESSLGQLLAAAIEFINANTSEGEREGKAPTPPEEEAAMAELKIKAANYEKAVEANKELSKRLGVIENERKAQRVDNLVQAQIDANKLNPNKEGAVEAARVLAENQEEAFTKMFAEMEPYAPAESVTRGTGTSDGSNRGKIIAEAVKEHKVLNERPGAAGLRSYVDVVCQEEGVSVLTDDEFTNLEGGKS